MRKYLVLVSILICFCGCATSVDRQVTYKVKCKNCKTIYGKGDVLEILVDKRLRIERK